MIPASLQIISIGISLGLLLIFIKAVRRRYLSIKYSILWLSVCMISLLLSIFPDLVFLISILLGIQIPTNTLFFLALIFLLVLSFQQSVFLSRLEDKNRTLAQKLALLETEMHERVIVADQTPPE